MASNVIPMLSSSPPPLDENGSFDEDDDDFGDFTCAGGVKVLDSPPASPVKSDRVPLSPPENQNGSGSKKVTWNDDLHPDSGEDEPSEKPARQSTESNGFLSKEEAMYSEKIVVFSEDVEEFNCDEDEIDFGEEKQGLSAKYVFTHSEQHDNTSQESVTDSGLCSSSQRSETSPLPPGEVIFPELSPETEPEESQEGAFPNENGFAASFGDDVVSDVEFVIDACDEATTPVNETPSFSDSPQNSKVLLEDDFQDFSSPASFEPGCVSADGDLKKSQSRTERFESEESDDFADFACAEFDPSRTQVSETELCHDSFADFSQVPFESASTTEDSDWADFSVTSELFPEAGTSSGGLVSSPAKVQVQQMLISAFPSEAASELSVEESQLLPVQPILGQETSHSCMLWRRLENLDESVSLQYQWSGSHAFQKTLHSLNIDSRNIELIPPAQFDWSSSGLVNPLDPSQSSSSLLDLDFLTNLDTSPTNPSSAGKLQSTKTSSLEEELLGMESTFVSPMEPGQAGGDLVQKLLSSVPSSSLLQQSGLGWQPCTQLSARAAALLELLPDLSFMQAKVLMFPIRGSLDT